jgi:hypothetical protein
VREVVQRAEQYFQVPTSGNLYITPPGNKGFALHMDNVNVFFMQLQGPSAFSTTFLSAAFDFNSFWLTGC